MADYISSLEAQEIEDTLLGAVVHNKDMKLSPAQKAQARNNIGAGTSSSGLVVLAYFDTLEELEATVTNPAAGDAYGVGTTSPYDTYIYDGLHSEWVNNGNIIGLDGSNISAENIENALGYTPADADNLIIPALSITNEKLAGSSVGTSKILNSSVTRAKLASDALHSPVIRLHSGAANIDLTADDDGKTIMTMTSSVDFTVNLSADASANMPEGFEIAVCFYYGQSLQISIESGIYVAHSEFGRTRSGIIFSIPEQNTMIALKKVLDFNGYSYWLVTGNVEVVE